MVYRYLVNIVSGDIMAKVRSPNYPIVGLVKAIELADRIFKSEHTHKAAPEVMAKALGYSGLNGKSMGILSALKKYGLLEEVGKEVKISEDALIILVEPKESLERKKAIMQAAFMPALFSELRKQYGDALPSDENMRSYLLRNGFSPTSVDSPIRAYRETIGLVNDISSGYNDPLEDEGGASMDQAQETGVAPNPTGGGGISAPAAIQPGNKQDIFSLDEGQVIIQWPANMSEDSFEDFKEWLRLVEKKIGRAYKK